MQMNIDFWNLLYNHLEERRYDNIYQNAMNEAYTTVVFRMAMQCCFALILLLADLT